MENQAKTIAVLEAKIKGIFKQIKAGTLTPAKSNIAPLFNQLKAVDEASYLNLIADYKVIVAEFKSKQEALVEEGLSAL